MTLAGQLLYSEPVGWKQIYEAVRKANLKMSNLSADLNSYLSRSASSSSLSSVTSKLSSFKLPTLDTIKSFGGGGERQEDEEPFLGVQVSNRTCQHLLFTTSCWSLASNLNKNHDVLPCMGSRMKKVGNVSRVKGYFGCLLVLG